jgi:hypothetical protein
MSNVIVPLSVLSFSAARLPANEVNVASRVTPGA